MIVPVAASRAGDGAAEAAWAVSHAERRALVGGVIAALERLIAGSGDRASRDALILASSRLAAQAALYAEWALFVAREREAGLVLNGPREIAYLRDGGSPPALTRQASTQPSASGWLLPRRVARTASWSGGARLLRAVLRPRYVAVTHNPLLVAEAARASEAVGFHHAEALLPGVAESAASDAARHLAAEAASMLSACVPVPEPHRSRLRTLIESYARPLIGNADCDMRRLRDRSLPAAIWSGSAGNWAARAIGLEVMGRGGEVVRFDHGGSTGLFDHSQSLRLWELSASSRYVMPTQALANTGYLRSLGPATIGGGQGDPTFRFDVPRKATAASRPRVVYATAPLLGVRQRLEPMLPDWIYVDWQLRLIRMLMALPVDLVVKPHPEGYQHAPKALDALAATGAPLFIGGFREALAAADVVIFDMPASTALSETLCVDRRLVHIDLGILGATPEMAPLLDSRMRRVSAVHDDRCRPQVEAGELAAAVLDGGPAPDPGPFRRVLAGA